MTDTRLVYTTAPSPQVADALTHALLTAQLAACVNHFPGMRSHYRWEGNIESATEVAMLIKTHARHIEAVKALIAAEHPYDTPACLVLDIADGLPAFLQWIDDSTS